MEKEQNKEEKKPKKKKDKEAILYWSIVLIIAVVILFFAVSRFFSKTPEFPAVEYNNWEFTEMAGMWWFEWQMGETMYTVQLRFNTYEVEEIPINGKLDNEAFNAYHHIYITFDLSNNTGQDLAILALAATELTQNMATAINRTPVAACANTLSDACIDRPIRTCENIGEPVIYLKEGGNAKITVENTCVLVEGSQFELIKAIDLVLYRWYGII